MRATTDIADRPTPTLATPPVENARKARASDELYDFRRFNYADGWDSDDAALGWVDDEIVNTRNRRLH